LLIAGALFFGLAWRWRDPLSGATPATDDAPTATPASVSATVPFWWGAHGLLALAGLAALAAWPDEGGATATLAAGLLGGVALLYGAVAVAFGVPNVAVGAGLAVALSGQLLLPPGAPVADRAVNLALSALFLDAAARLHQRYGGGQSDHAAVAAEGAKRAAGVYEMLASAAGVLALCPRCSTSSLAMRGSRHQRIWARSRAACSASSSPAGCSSGRAGATRLATADVAFCAALGIGAFVLANLVLLALAGRDMGAHCGRASAAARAAVFGRRGDPTPAPTRGHG
jgi:hypothetical protein